MLNRRPKPGDTEEDLLKFQQEFLSGQTTPSASLVKKPGDKRKSVQHGQPGGVDPMESGRDIVQLQGEIRMLPLEVCLLVFSFIY